MPTYTLSALTILLLLILGGYVVYQSRRSRETELGFKLRKSVIALHDAEQALENTLDYYLEEIARLQSRLLGAPGRLSGGGSEVPPGQGRFRPSLSSGPCPRRRIRGANPHGSLRNFGKNCSLSNPAAKGSHNPNEAMDMDDFFIATQILGDAMLRAVTDDREPA